MMLKIGELYKTKFSSIFNKFFLITKDNIISYEKEYDLTDKTLLLLAFSDTSVLVFCENQKYVKFSNNNLIPLK
jgi:hypothetical protein